MEKIKDNHLRPNGALLDITTICPHNCVYCYHQKANLLKPKNMTIETFNSIIKIMAKEEFERVYLYMSGEPLANPWFYYFLTVCGQERFETNVATKAGIPIRGDVLAAAQKEYKRGAGELRWLVEVPAWNQETANHFCSIDLEKQKENLRLFGSMVGKYKNVSFRIRTIVTRWNEHELKEIKNGLAEMGLNDWAFKRPGYFISPPKEDEEWIPSEKYRRRFTMKREKCPYPRNVAINVSGDVSICCHDMLFQIKIGNIVKEGTLKGIIERNQDVMRRRLSMGLKICERCN